METGGFVLRPKNEERFRVSTGKKILEEVMTECLFESQALGSGIKMLSENIGDAIRERLQALNLPKYKYIIQVVIGEHRGQGTRINGACLWDSDTDATVHHLIKNNDLFCEAIVFAVFQY